MYSLSRLAEFIKGLQADVIGLQEVDTRWDERSNYDEQLPVLAGLLGMHAISGPAMTRTHRDGTTGTYGNAILTSGAATSSITHPLQGEGEPRSVLVTTVELANTELRFAVTHLNDQDEAVRRAQVAQLLSLLPDGDPVVCVGDFNAVPDSAASATMRLRFRDACADASCDDTWTHARPSGERVRIDYVYVSQRVSVRSCRVVPSIVSDHMAVVAGLELNPP